MRPKNRAKGVNMHGRLLFGQGLRLVRKASKWPISAIAQDLSMDSSTLLRWERGERMPDASSIEAVERYFGVPGDLLQWLADLSRNADEPYGSLLENEPNAAIIRIWENRGIIPGVLQNEEYAMALLRDQRLVDQRMARRASLFDRDHPADMRVVIAEGTLRTTIGSRDITRRQLEFLIADDAPWTLHVLPRSTPMPPVATTGPVMLLDVAEDTLIYVEGWRLNGMLNAMAATREAWQAWDAVLGVSLPPDGTREMIRSLIGELND